MTRISSTMINSTALQNLQKSQFELFDAQRKTATQKQADDLKGYGHDAKTLVSLDRMRAKAESYITTAEELNIRLDLQDTQIDQMANIVANLREDLTSALALDDLSTTDRALHNAFNELKSSMNANHNSIYLFAGTASDTPPVQSASIDDLATNPLADAVSSDGQTVNIRIDDSRLVEAAPLARDFAPPVLDILRDLKIFQDGATGPFNTTPDAAQRQAIQTAIAQLASVHDDLVTVQGRNGLSMNETDTILNRQRSEINLLESLSADISEVDLAEVAVQLNQAQVQYQATASVFNTIQGLSLVDYLR